MGPGEAPVGDEGPEPSLLTGDEGSDAFLPTGDDGSDPFLFAGDKGSDGFIPTGDDGSDPFLPVADVASLGDEGPGDAVLSPSTIVQMRRNQPEAVCGVQISM